MLQVQSLPAQLFCNIMEPTNLAPMLGLKFGKLTVVARAGATKQYLAKWLCRCECGNEVVKIGSDLRYHDKPHACRTCAAEIRRTLLAEAATRHGETGTYLYTLWSNIRKRCGLIKGGERCAKHYVDRGITVHQPWADSYEEFAKYIRRYLGERPSTKHSLDRKNNDKGYVPGNLRWATQSQQVRNSRRNRKI